LRAAVIAPHVEQAQDLLRRLVKHCDRLPLALLQSADSYTKCNTLPSSGGERRY
jgi:hypothetical protein